MLTLMLHTYSPGYSKGKTVAFNTSKALLVVYPLGKLIGLLLVINILNITTFPLSFTFFITATVDEPPVRSQMLKINNAFSNVKGILARI